MKHSKQTNLYELWVKCHFLRDIANQRQALVNLMINIAGDHLRSKAKEQIFPLPLEFQMGDKEAFQAIPNSGLMPSYKNSYYLTELRGRRRHHVESEFTSEQVKNELMVLHEYGSLANDEELAWIFLNAWYIMTRRLAHDIQVTERDVKWRHLVADQDTKLSKN